MKAVGVEPTTHGLKVRCSTTELRLHRYKMILVALRKRSTLQIREFRVRFALLRLYLVVRCRAAYNVHKFIESTSAEGRDALADRYPRV